MRGCIGFFSDKIGLRSPWEVYVLGRAVQVDPRLTLG